MAVTKIDPKVIFASEAPVQDTPAVFVNKTVGWGESRKNGGRPTIKQSNALQQETDLKILWLNENAVTPYDATIDYPQNAVTIKDGEFKILNGGIWETFLNRNHSNLTNRDAASSHPASAISTANAQTQQVVNDSVGAKWYAKVGGYSLNARVMLDNGDIVKSTVSNNTTNPNVDMVGWEFEKFDLSSFGLDATGNTACDDLLIKAFKYSSDRKIPLKNHRGTYLLDGDKTITINYDCDLTGTILKLGENFTGKIVVKNQYDPTIHGASSGLVTALKAIGTVAKNTNVVAALAGLDQGYLWFKSTQPMFNYRGTVYTRNEPNELFNGGILNSGMLYDFDMSLLTEVVHLNRSDRVMIVSGLTIDETLLNRTSGIPIVDIFQSSEILLINPSFIGVRQNIFNGAKITTSSSANVHILNPQDFRTANSDASYDYIVSTQNSYNIRIENAKSSGNGWGATASFETRRIEFINCDLSRIDTHTPALEYLKITNTRLHGFINFSGLNCDLIINDLTVYPNLASNALIECRADCGSIMDGNLIIAGLKLASKSSNADYSLLYAWQSQAYEKPVGSPASNSYFNSIDINDIQNLNGGFKYILRAQSDRALKNTLFTIPDSMVINGYKVIDGLTNDEIHFNFDNFVNSAKTHTVDITNATTSSLRINDTSGVNLIDFNLIDCRAENGGISIINTSKADIVMNGGKLWKYSEYDDTEYKAFNPLFLLSGGRLNNGSDVIFNVAANAKNRLSVLNSQITTVTANYVKAANFTAKNNTFNKDYLIRLVSDNSASSATMSYSNIKAVGYAVFIVQVGFGANIKTDKVTVFLEANTTTNCPNCVGNIAVSVTSGYATVTFTATNSNARLLAISEH